MEPTLERHIKPPGCRRAGINLGLRLVVGGVFVVAGGLKAMHPAEFAVAVGHYRLLPLAGDNLVALTLPWVEVTAGLFVLAGVWLRAAALVIALLTAGFMVAILSALARGLNIECGCFGTVDGRPIGVTSLALDTGLMALAGWLVRRTRGISGERRG